uniref:Uncharacterized protein n=1 Tax=Opuntia streptacantha TaxID=393608 RepID=A0A7C8Z4D7_OPUST
MILVRSSQATVISVASLSCCHSRESPTRAISPQHFCLSCTTLRLLSKRSSAFTSCTSSYTARDSYRTLPLNVVIPQGAGRRGYPGITFGAVTVKLALAQLLHSFDL